MAACQRQLRQAQESVRAAGEALRRMIRSAASAQCELDEALERQGRLDSVGPTASELTRMVVAECDTRSADAGRS